jgi:GNAT superfamily N-acetyltransferase
MRQIEFEVRQATPADANDIAAAHADSIHSIGALFYSADVVDDWSARVTGDFYLRAMTGGGVFFIAVAPQSGTTEVFGFSSHNIVEGKHRTAVYVRGYASRRGIGSALFRMAEAAAVAAGASSIHVDASLSGVDFYRANGFDEIGRGDHRLRSGRLMPCVFMQKKLSQTKN